MTLAQFLRLVGAGEKFNVDFKLQCNAFNPAAGDHKKAKAELVKDICAMANNSGSTSYLIIGLGDDRKTVRSVVEHALTSQNIQPFLRENIMPLPKVTVKRAKWNDAPAPFAGVEFVIIQVGPHPRAAYRFARDHIDGCGKFHFRKNEVWVRNEDTSDLATPERIGQLLGMRRFAEAEPELSFTNVEYQILPKAAQIAALAADVQTFFQERGWALDAAPKPQNDIAKHAQHEFLVRCLIQQEPVVLRCVFLERLTSDSDKFFGLSECWRCEHGVMIFVLGNYTKEGRFGGLTLDCKKKWGSFALIHPVANRFLKECLPKGFAKAEICIITLSKLSDTRRVRDCLARGFKDFEEGEDFFLHLSKALNGMNAELQRWSKSTKGNLAGAFDWNRKDQSDLFVSAAKAIVRLTESADK